MHDLLQSVLFTLIISWCLISNSLCSLENGINEFINDTPIPYDDWCRDHCDSPISCNAEFGDNYVDLTVRNDFSISQGTLLNGMFLGDAISRQSFETQFIFDISKALSISPCRLYIVDTAFERDGLSLNPDCVFVTFRLYPVDHKIIFNLTEQVQDYSSNIYDGHVSV